MSLNYAEISAIILKHHSETQAIYLFGSFAAGRENKNSDVDIAVLLRHAEAKKLQTFAMTEVLHELSMKLNKDVDLINLRMVSTVFQIQIIDKGNLIFCADENAKDEFEMITISLYQKLNEERKEILEDFLGEKL